MNIHRLASATVALSLLVGFAFPQTTYAAAPADYISCWDLEETSGTRVDANTTNSNDLTDNNTVLYGTGKVGANAADIEHTNTEYLSITDASQASLDLNGSFSMNIWANFESLASTAGTYYGLMGKYSSSPANRAYALYFDDADKLKLDVAENSGGTIRRYSVATNVTITSGELGTWHMYTAVFDMPTATITLYKDGSSLALTTNNAGSLTAIYNNSLPFTLGHANQAGNQTFDGLLDVAEIYSRTLSGTEVSALYNAGAGAGCTGRGSSSTRRIIQ